MKTIYFATLLLLFISCTKEDIAPEEENILLKGVNEIRVNGNPTAIALDWNDELYEFSERMTNYTVKDGKSPDYNSVINEMGGLKTKFCYFMIDTSNVSNFNLMDYLKTNFSNYIQDPKYGSFAIYEKDNITTFCFGYL